MVERKGRGEVDAESFTNRLLVGKTIMYEVHRHGDQILIGIYKKISSKYYNTEPCKLKIMTRLWQFQQHSGQ